MAEKFLDKVYKARTAAETRALYDDWSATYEAEVAENGYATPARCADALARCVAFDAAILDFGCGTGLSGLALRAAGFTTLDGVDLSADMLAQARAKGLYRALRQIGATDPLGVTPGDYAAIAAIGVIGAGAAPIAVFDRLMEALAPGGHLVLSFNDHALADPENEARLDTWVASGRARLAFREYGPHLPKLNLNSNVYVLERT